MANVAIVNNETLDIVCWYEDASANQSSFGGDWSNPDLFTHVLLESGSTDIVFASLVEGEIVLSIDTDKQAAKQFEAVKQAVKAAKDFGSNLADEFVAENILLGISADNMTESVLETTQPIMAALQAGSLYLAIDRIRAVPAESKDAKYITDVRLLKNLNLIEAYLDLELSETL